MSYGAGKEGVKQSRSVNVLDGGLSQTRQTLTRQSLECKNSPKKKKKKNNNDKLRPDEVLTEV